MATGYIAGIFGTGGSSSSSVPVVVSGSPFTDYDALDAWSQANSSELLNNENFYATAELDDGTNYQWEGADGVYSANGWIRVNGLNNEEQEAVDSIVNAPDNEILVTGEGTDSGTLVSKGITVSDTDIDTNGRSITVSVGSVNLGGAQSISAAGRNVATKDLVSQSSRHSVWQTFDDGNTAVVRVRTTLSPVTVSDKTADLVNPVWTQAAATVDQTVKQVVLDFTNAVTNFVVELDIGGVDFFKENLGDFAAGEQTVVLNPPTDVFQGDVVTFKLTSEDGDVTVKGNSGTGVPYQVATIASWVDESISGGGDVTGPSSSVDSELAVFDGADGDAVKGGTNVIANVGNAADIRLNTDGVQDPRIYFDDGTQSYDSWVGYDINDFQMQIASGSGMSISNETNSNSMDISSGAFGINISTSNSGDISINPGGNFDLSTSSGSIDITASSGVVQVNGSTIQMNLPDMSMDYNTNGITMTPTSNAVYGFGFGGDSSISQNPTTGNMQISSAAGDMICQVLNGYSMSFSSAQDATFSAATGNVSFSAAGESLTFDGETLSFDSVGSDQEIRFAQAVIGHSDAGNATILGTNNDLLFQIINGDWNTTSQQGIEMLASTTLNLDCTAGNTILNADTNLALTGNTVNSTSSQTMTLNSTNSNVEINANNGQIELSSNSGLSNISLQANSVIHSDVQLNISGGAECSFNAGLSLGFSSTSGTTIATNTADQFPLSLVSSGVGGGGRMDQHVIDYDPEGTLTALTGAIAYRIDTTNGTNIKEYRLKSTGVGFFNTPWVEVGGSGDGDVVGPASSVDTEIAVFNGATGDTIEGTTNITAAVGQNNAKLDLNTTNNSNDPEIWFNGASSQQEGWVYLDADTNTFNVRGANSASYTAGTKLDIGCDAGDIDINTLSSQINITAETNALLSSGSGNTTVLSNAGNVKIGGGRIINAPSSDVYINSSASESAGFALTVAQSVTNGGNSEIVSGNRNPNGNVNATNERIYLRSGSRSSDIYVGVGTSNTDWNACGGRGAPWQWGNNGVNSGTTQRFMSPGIDFNDGAGTNESNLILPITRDGYFQRMRVRHNDPNGNGNNIVYTLRVNGGNSSLSVTLASDSTVSSNNGTRVAVSAGDTISIGVTKPQGGVNNSPNNVNVQIDFY